MKNLLIQYSVDLNTCSIFMLKFTEWLSEYLEVEVILSLWIMCVFQDILNLRNRFRWSTRILTNCSLIYLKLTPKILYMLQVLGVVFLELYTYNNGIRFTRVMHRYWRSCSVFLVVLFISFFCFIYQHNYFDASRRN